MPPRSKVITLDVTEIPRCCSIFIQSDRARRLLPRARTSPARWIAPPNSSSFSVRVVLPASGCEMIAKVRRPFGRLALGAWADMARSLPIFTGCGKRGRVAARAEPPRSRANRRLARDSGFVTV